MVFKIVSNNIHKKPNQINYYTETKVDSLENISTKITQEVLSLSNDTICWKKTKW